MRLRSTLFALGVIAALCVAGCSDEGLATTDVDEAPPTTDEGGDVESPDDRDADVIAEAGFVEVPPSTIGGPSWSSRMFYSFRPAEVNPARAPIVVFFNGGPGSATTSILLPFGTGPFTLDPSAPEDTTPVANDSSYTRFANLLYIDARGTGFSYELAPFGERGCSSAAQYGNDANLYVDDAADFIHVLLDFLDKRAALRNNPVVLAGESYGGARATLMLYLMQHYADPDPLPLLSLAPAWLSERVQAHLDLAFPAEGSSPRMPADVARQFRWQLLIQPNIRGMAQFQFENPLERNNPDVHACHIAGGEVKSGCDDYDTRRSIEDAMRLDSYVKRAMRTPAHLRTLLGVDLATIQGLPASERGEAFRLLDWHSGDDAAASEDALRAELGELAEGDAYWLPYALPCRYFLGDERVWPAFEANLLTTMTFVTNARYDRVVYTEALPRLLPKGVVDRSQPPGAKRPGVLRATISNQEISIRFPTYESGHEVTAGAPRALAEDFEAWLFETKASAAPR